MNMKTLKRLVRSSQWESCSTEKEYSYSRSDEKEHRVSARFQLKLRFNMEILVLEDSVYVMHICVLCKPEKCLVFSITLCLLLRERLSLNLVSIQLDWLLNVQDPFVSTLQSGGYRRIHSVHGSWDPT